MIRLGITFIWLFAILSVPVYGSDMPKCLFYASFDGSLDATVAHGGDQPIKATPVRYAEGVRGKAVILGGRENPAAGPALLYEAKGNLNPAAGTILFWAKCVGEDNFQLSGGNYTLVSWRTGNNSPCLWMFYRWAAGGSTGGAAVRNNSTLWSHHGGITWNRNEWVHVAFAWNSKGSSIYFNGNRIAESSTPVPDSSGLHPQFAIGEDNRSSVAIDEFYIIDKAMSESEVKEIFALGSGVTLGTSPLPQPLITVGKANRAPVIDGVLGSGEWDQAASFCGLTDETTGNYAKQDIVTYMAYDGENLYLAFEQKMPEILRTRPEFYPNGPLKRAQTRQDGPVWKDDSYEVQLIGPKGDSARIVVNPVGTVYDERDGKASWTSQTKVGSVFNDDSWVLEMSVPWAALDITPTPGLKLGMNLKRIFRVIDDTRLVWSAGTKPGSLCLSENTPIARLLSIGKLLDGQYDVQLNVINPSLQDKNVKATISVGDKPPLEEEVTVGLASQGMFETSGQFYNDIRSFVRVTATIDDQSVMDMAMPFLFVQAARADLEYYPSRDILRITIDKSGIDAKGIVADVSVLDPSNNDVLISGTIKEFKADSEHVDLDMSMLGPGEFPVSVEIKNQSGPLVLIKRTAKKYPKPEWLGNCIGKTNRVPAPWTPLAVEESSSSRKKVVRCWGREYDVTDALFFSQITSNSKQLLSEPIRVIATIQNRKLRFDKGISQVTVSSPKRVTIASEGGNEYFRAQTKTLIEYDGFTFTELGLTPRNKGLIQELYLEIPFNPRYTHLYHCGNTWFSNIGSGSIPAEGWKSPPNLEPNFQWVGDVDSGIQFYYKDRMNWNVGNTSLSEIIPSRGTMVYRVYLINKPTQISKTLKYGFGVMATPVKPRHPQWRKWWIGPLPWQSYIGWKGQINLQLWFTDWSDGDNIPRPHPAREPGMGQDNNGSWITARQAREKGVEVVPYVSGQLASYFAPEYQYFQEEWRRIPSKRKLIEEGQPRNWWLSGQVCSGSSFKDFWLYEMSKTLKAADFRGIYFDNMFPAPCSNQNHGCGYVGSDGKPHPSLPLFETREWLERMYVMMKDHDPNSVIAFHTSGSPYMPYCSFTDIMLHGEQFERSLGTGDRIREGKDNYFDILTPDRMRAEYAGYNWGPATCFLTEFARPTARGDMPNRGVSRPSRYFEDSPRALREINHVVGMLLLHDAFFPYVFQVNRMPFYTARRAQLNFGWDETVQFIPYWNNRYVNIKSGNVEPILCSIYTRSNRAMFVVMNNSDEPAEVRMKIDYSGLGFRPESEDNVIDGVTGAMFGYQGKEDVVGFDLAPRSFRMLVTGGTPLDILEHR